jgi:ubiquinone/menaquinone biosynthesis C-methylase UbiE
MLPIIIGVVVVVLILVALDREIYFYEASHLGPRVQSWLYDRWAKKYDTDKGASQVQDAELLAAPVLDALAAASVPPADVLMLDVATGTGRMPATIFRESAFQGKIIALDISREMLVKTAEKIAPYRDRTLLLRYQATRLPFPDATFEVVSCMEALELMASREDALREFMRVLRPGGVLVTSRATEASGRVGLVMAATKFEELLQTIGFTEIKMLPLWKLFDRVFARKAGNLTSGGVRAPLDVLQCPSCQQAKLTIQDSSVRCSNCGAIRTLTEEGIILY